MPSPSETLQESRWTPRHIVNGVRPDGGSRSRSVAFRVELDDFAALYERTYPIVFRTVLGICGDASLAADLTQDAYVLAYRRRSTFRGEVPAEAWLHRIAVNTAL